jgi:hypothetical protein
MEERTGNDVEFEDVRELVRDQPVERIGRLVDRQDHAVAIRLREGQNPLGQLAGLDVLLLEFALRFIEDERHLESEIMFQIRADLLVRAFRVRGDALEL